VHLVYFLNSGAELEEEAVRVPALSVPLFLGRPKNSGSLS